MNDGQEVRLYFSDDGPVMAGFLIAVTTCAEDEKKPSFEEGRTLEEYFYEPIKLTKGSRESLGDDDMIWLVLEGWDMDVARWENFEPGGLGAALTRERAESIEAGLEPFGNFVVLGLKNGWRYGHDPVPDLEYPAEHFYGKLRPE